MAKRIDISKHPFKNLIGLKERDFFFDNAKFFLILLVILGHAIEILDGRYISLLYKLIYLFHVPALVAVSGYFSRLQKKTGVIRLLIQYLFCKPHTLSLPPYLQARLFLSTKRRTGYFGFCLP